MTNPFVMLLLLVLFSASLSVVLSCYRDDEPGDVLRGARRRTLVFTGAVLSFALIAWVVSSTVLYPS